jgi:hypothetical protein
MTFGVSDFWRVGIADAFQVLTEVAKIGKAAPDSWQGNAWCCSDLAASCFAEQLTDSQ